jgi:Protein of unknown function (DUF3034)
MKSSPATVRFRSCAFGAFGVALLFAAPAYAGGDRLLGTGGVMQVEGAAGGGLVPWALIAGLGTRDQIGGSAFCTQVEPQDFRLTSCGVAVGIHDRLEVSFARQEFDLGTTVPGKALRQNVVGAKYRLIGDAIYAQDTWTPQVAVGVQFKKNLDYDLVPKLLGAVRDNDADLYVAATKLYLSGPLGRSWLLNATLRATRSNQLGILGFGGDDNDRFQLQPELSVAVFVHDHVILGAEYRAKPDNLTVFEEEDYWDAFVAWVPVKSVSLTLAYADLGNIADKSDQKGWYGSLQASF